MGVPYTSAAVANAFLSLAWQVNKQLTNLELQKLVFFADGWFYNVKNVRLVSEDAEAWQFGPVYPILYQALKRYGDSPVISFIKTEDKVTNEGENLNFDFIKIIFNKYKDCTAAQLVAVSHRLGSPWQRALANGRNIITNEDIASYYGQFK